MRLVFNRIGAELVQWQFRARPIDPGYRTILG
jgi:hypothetical protein